MSREIQILLVEDNPGDARLVAELLKEGQVPHRLAHVTDGVEALTYLHQQGTHAGARRPDLLLLDLNLPRKDGRELLAEIKTDEKLRRIPVLVLTTSQAEDDIFIAYNLGANCFLTKPVDLEEFSRVVKCIEDFWLSMAKLPTK